MVQDPFLGPHWNVNNMRSDFCTIWQFTLICEPIWGSITFYWQLQWFTQGSVNCQRVLCGNQHWNRAASCIKLVWTGTNNTSGTKISTFSIEMHTSDQKRRTNKAAQGTEGFSLKTGAVPPIEGHLGAMYQMWPYNVRTYCDEYANPKKEIIQYVEKLKRY